MSDLLARLRRESNVPREYDDEAGSLLSEAADEIERLTEEISRLRMKLGPDEMTEGEYYTLARLEEDNEKLREALSRCTIECGELHHMAHEYHTDNNCPVESFINGLLNRH